ncbi:DUF397 domain-containing protein [Kitasatospora sp. NPDC048365]|uniref:DUF397 domain-containing protein n=1 Tax=Kitasatospora sp. NPDC048365 TaxID=3364050 RepID=UPI003713EB5D
MSGSTRASKPKVLDLEGAQWLAAPGAEDGPQVAFVGDFIALRSGADLDSPALIFDQDEWQAFRRGAARGEFSDLR